MERVGDREVKHTIWPDCALKATRVPLEPLTRIEPSIESKSATKSHAKNPC